MNRQERRREANVRTKAYKREYEFLDKGLSRDTEISLDGYKINRLWLICRYYSYHTNCGDNVIKSLGINKLQFYNKVIKELHEKIDGDSFGIPENLNTIGGLIEETLPLGISDCIMLDGYNYEDSQINLDVDKMYSKLIDCKNNDLFNSRRLLASLMYVSVTGMNYLIDNFGDNSLTSIRDADALPIMLATVTDNHTIIKNGEVDRAFNKLSQAELEKLKNSFSLSAVDRYLTELIVKYWNNYDEIRIMRELEDNYSDELIQTYLKLNCTEYDVTCKVKLITKFIKERNDRFNGEYLLDNIVRLLLLDHTQVVYENLIETEIRNSIVSKVTEVKSEILELNKEKEKYKAEIGDLRADINKFLKVNKNLSTEMALLKKQNSSLKLSIDNNITVKELKKEKQSLISENKKLIKDTTKFENRSKSLEEKVNEKDIEIEKLRAQLRDQSERMDRLENILTRTELCFEENTFDEDIELLKDKKIVVIGGLAGFKERLIKILPNIEVLPYDEIGRAPQINNVDLVGIYWRAISHSNRWSIESQLKSNKTPMVYVGSSNIENAVKELASAFK